MRYLFKEVDLNKKKEKLLNIYKDIIKKNNYKSKNILFIVPNSITKLNYLRSLDLRCSEELKITTYSHFVHNELIKYWPIVAENCSKINGNKISPSFISQSLSEYILIDFINKKRNNENYFEDIVGTDKGICTNILDNLSKACFNDIDINAIGEKIYESKKNKDNLMRFSYSQMQEVIDFYVNTLLSNSIIDNSISVYLYNNFLLNNDFYIKRLREEYDYLIIDSLESSSVSEVNLITELIDNAKEAYIFYDNSKDYSSFKNTDIKHLEENIIKKYFTKDDIGNKLEKISLMKLYEFKELKYTEKIKNIKEETESKQIEDVELRKEIEYRKKIIELDESASLYDEMINNSVEKIEELVHRGTELKDIAIISPINNSILDYKISNLLKDKNIEVANTKIDSKIMDHAYANALVVATCIFYNLQSLIKDEEYINFIEIIFGVNKIRALKIFNNRHTDENYMNLIQYIQNKQSKDIKISEFLIQFYIEKILNLKDGKKEIISCKEIIKQSESFSDILDNLEIKDEKEIGEVFIKCLKSNINDFYMSSDIEDMKNSDKIIITTPYTYIGSNINRKIQFWIDIGSNAWNMRIEKDISNPLVLRKSFKEKEIYSDEIEEINKKYYLYNLVYNLLINSKEVYAYKSEYSINGFMQESMLYGLLLRLLDRGDKDND